MGRISVNWHVEMTGHISDSRPDKWYLKGSGIPAHSRIHSRFFLWFDGHYQQDLLSNFEISLG
jgi:hypothetical protein